MNINVVSYRNNEMFSPRSIEVAEAAPIICLALGPSEQSSELSLTSAGLTLKLMPANARYERCNKGPNVAETLEEDGFHRVGDAATGRTP
jgi:hypothetical protein